MSNLTYSERLAYLGLESLELRRLLQDLVCTYKILSTEHQSRPAYTRAHSLMYVDAENFLTVNSSSQMRGHIYISFINLDAAVLCVSIFFCKHNCKFMELVTTDS